MALSQDEQVIWDALADEAAHVIDDRARDRDKLRERYADVMGKGDFRNRDFDGLVNVMFDAFPEIERKYARSGDRLSDFLPEAVGDIVDGHFANSVLSDRRLSDDLDDRTFREMEDAVHRYKDLVRGRRGERGGREERDRDGRRGGGTGYSRERGRDRDNSRDMGREARNAGGGWRNRSATRRAAAGEGWNDVARDAAATQQAEVRREEPAARPVPVPVEQVAAAPAPAPQRPALDGPDFTKARPYDDYWVKGEHWIVAIKSPWKLEWDDQNPLASVPSLYDVRTHVKYHVKSEDGKVREELVKVQQDNRYLAHDQMAQPERYQSPRSSSPAVSLSGKPVAEEDKLNDVQAKPQVSYLTDVLKGLDTTHFVPGEGGAPLAETIEGLVFDTRVKMFGSDRPQRLNVCFRTTPLIASSWKQEDLIREVYNCHNLAAAAVKMQELKDQFDAPIWNVLNKRFSTLVLRALTLQFQYNSVKSLSFAEHWDRLINHLETQKGEGFASDFAQRTNYIVTMASTLADRADLPGFTGREDEDVPCIVFLEQIAMIAINATMDGLGLGNVLEKMELGVSITASGDADLNAAVRHVYGKLDGNAPTPGACRVFLNTSDGTLMELLPFAARKENYILAVAK